MKALILIASIALLSSCGDSTKTVRLYNFSKVVAKTTSGIEYHAGETVCVVSGNRGDWYIDNQGIMADTTVSRVIGGIKYTKIYHMGKIVL